MYVRVSRHEQSLNADVTIQRNVTVCCTNATSKTDSDCAQQWNVHTFISTYICSYVRQRAMCTPLRQHSG